MSQRPVILVPPFRRRPEKFWLWLPGIVTLGWVFFTLLLYVNGPYRWLDQSHDRLIRYIVTTMAFFAVGYALGLQKKSRPPLFEKPPLRLLKVSGLLVGLPLFAVLVTGDLFRWVALARRGIGDAYRAWTDAAGTSFWPYLDIFVAPLTAPFIPVSIFYWRRLPRVYKLALSFVLVVMMVATVSSGRRSGVVSVAMVAIASLAARVAGAPLTQRRRLVKRFVLLLIVFVMLMLPFLRFVAEGRAGLYVDLTYNPVTRERPEPEHFLTRTIPVKWAPTFFTGVFYVTHGYFPLEQALEMPFIGITYGLGQSWFLARQAERLGVPESVLAPAYDRRLTERGYVVGDFWMTVFPWLASDLTFPGTWFALALFGYLLARSWESATTTGHPWSITLFGILIYFSWSLPMSNPMQDGAGLTRMIGVYLIWAVCMFIEAHRRALVREAAPRPPSLAPAGGSAVS
jgi:hypothetical protein